MKNFVLIVGAFLLSIRLSAQQRVVVDPPDGRGPLTLAALYDSAAGHNAFAYCREDVQELSASGSFVMRAHVCGAGSTLGSGSGAGPATQRLLLTEVTTTSKQKGGHSWRTRTCPN
jgi:hypothetical protein